jgi:hypothetical protein
MCRAIDRDPEPPIPGFVPAGNGGSSTAFAAVLVADDDRRDPSPPLGSLHFMLDPNDSGMASHATA